MIGRTKFNQMPSGNLDLSESELKVGHELFPELDYRRIKRILTIKELARILQISVSQVYKLVERNEIPCYRIGRAIRFDYEDIEEWLRPLFKDVKR